MANSTFDFAGKVALVCGSGAGGIGTATALTLAKGGAHIVAVDHTDELLEATVKQIEGMGGQCLPIRANLRDAQQTKNVIDVLKKEIGHVDLIANIAGGTQKGEWLPLEYTSDEVYASVFGLNLDYVFRICRDAGLMMIERGKGGSIVNIASYSAIASAPFHGPYGAAKRGVAALTQTMAIEWARHGIRANTVFPGSTNTARSQSLSSSGHDRNKVWSPLGRKVEPQEMANAICFFLSDLASGITGQSMVVDAGVSARSIGGGLEVFSTFVDGGGIELGAKPLADA